MATKIKKETQFVVPEFLLDKAVEKFNISEEHKFEELGKIINASLLEYIVNGEQPEETIRKELQDYKDMMRNCLISLCYLIAKNFAYDIVKDSRGTKNEIPPERIEELAEESVISALSSYLSFGEENKEIKRKELKMALHSYNYSSTLDENFDSSNGSERAVTNEKKEEGDGK